MHPILEAYLSQEINESAERWQKNTLRAVEKWAKAVNDEEIGKKYSKGLKELLGVEIDPEVVEMYIEGIRQPHALKKFIMKVSSEHAKRKWKSNYVEGVLSFIFSESGVDVPALLRVLFKSS